MTAKHPVLDAPMGKNDISAKTLRDYLKELLMALWTEGDGFSGKRPFGNSGWQEEVYIALAQNRDLFPDGLDEEGYLSATGFDYASADRMILKAIAQL